MIILSENTSADCGDCPSTCKEENVTIERLDTELLVEKFINVDKYNAAYEKNKDDFYEEEFSHRGVGYAGAIFHLLNDFIKAGSDDDSVVRKSIFIEQFSGGQVDMAKSVYNRLLQ